MEKDYLIVGILKEAVLAAARERSHKSLMRLGMALHTFADWDSFVIPSERGKNVDEYMRGMRENDRL